jgi:hypothetical protein
VDAVRKGDITIPPIKKLENKTVSSTGYADTEVEDDEPPF